MPYSPGTQFDPSLIFRGIAGAGEALGGGLADTQKKREQAEAQMAGSMFGFQTLKKAGLIDPEEETKFLQGNANQRNAIVMAATPRLLQKFQTEKEANDQRNAQMQRALQLRIAQMHYGALNQADGMTPYQREQTRLREMDILRKQQRNTIPPQSRALARGRLKADGTFDNNYPEAASGDMAQVQTPDGKKLIVPWSDYQAITGAQPAQPPQAAEVPAAPVTAIIEKGGHHYEVDHASKKVLRQID